MQKLKTLIVGGIAAALFASPAFAAGGAKHPHAPEDADGSDYEWSFEGPFGDYDQASLQRGYQVYREVCSSCHGMKLISYTDLAREGGPFAGSEEQAKAFAALDIIQDVDEEGDVVDRPAQLADTFMSPYPNEQRARSVNGGALPPDMSVIIKARHGGANYLYSLLTGYPDQDDLTTAPSDQDPGRRALVIKDKDTGEVEGTLYQAGGLYYNPYFAGDTTPNWTGDPREAPYGGFIAMAPQLVEGRVEYMDGTEATVSQMAKDVTYFLMWASEPKLETRKKLGLATMGYLALLTILLYFSYRQIWRNVEH